MTLTALPTTIDTSRATSSLRKPESVMISQAYHTSAPWQYGALIQLHALSTTPTVMERDANITASETTVMFARAALARLPDLNLPTPTVCPVSGGSVGIVWSVGSKQLEAIFDSDQLGTYVLSMADQIIGDGEIDASSISQLESALKSLVT
jgi:hypothetical protein